MLFRFPIYNQTDFEVKVPEMVNVASISGTDYPLFREMVNVASVSPSNKPLFREMVNVAYMHDAPSMSFDDPDDSMYIPLLTTV